MINTPHIAFRRIGRGLTQRELADRIGVTKDHLSRIERGVMRPGYDVLVSLCRELDTEPNKVITGWQK